MQITSWMLGWTLRVFHQIYLWPRSWICFIQDLTLDFSNKTVLLKHNLLTASQSVSSFSVRSFVNTFTHCKVRKSPGPNNIGSRMLSHWAEQIGPTFYYIFNVILSAKGSQLMATIYNSSLCKKYPSQDSEWLQACSINLTGNDVLWKADQKRTPRQDRASSRPITVCISI